MWDNYKNEDIDWRFRAIEILKDTLIVAISMRSDEQEKNEILSRF